MIKATKKTKKAIIPKPSEVPRKVQRYFQGFGGRKTAAAQVRIFPKQEGIKINDRELKTYFRSEKDQYAVLSPLELVGLKNAFGVTVKVHGSGIHSQADAVRHGLAKALVHYDPSLKKKLKVAGLITRDPRAVERKKYGLKKARRAPQWAKR